jgi:hypothetical protein
MVGYRVLMLGNGRYGSIPYKEETRSHKLLKTRNVKCALANTIG